MEKERIEVRNSAENREPIDWFLAIDGCLA